MRNSYKRGADLGHIGCKIQYANDLYKQKRYSDAIDYSKSIEGSSLAEPKDILAIS